MSRLQVHVCVCVFACEFSEDETRVQKVKKTLVSNERRGMKERYFEKAHTTYDVLFCKKSGKKIENKTTKRQEQGGGGTKEYEEKNQRESTFASFFLLLFAHTRTRTRTRTIYPTTTTTTS